MLSRLRNPFLSVEIMLRHKKSGCPLMQGMSSYVTGISLLCNHKQLYRTYTLTHRFLIFMVTILYPVINLNNGQMHTQSHRVDNSHEVRVPNVLSQRMH